MQYRIDTKSNNKLSILGFGCMRFPKNMTQIDMGKTEQLILQAVQSGVNYFDTAYLYNGSEVALGEIIKKNSLRDKIFLATKLPHSRCHSPDDFEKLFQEQLSRLGTGYIDYYLIHNLSETGIWDNLCKLGIAQWIAEKKNSGQIKQIGFSFHGIQENFIKLLDAYAWDFCQIQYNYMNVNFQAGLTGLKEAAKRGLPVIIMEPLLGGKLAAGLPKKATELFSSVNPSCSAASWALRWLWNQNEPIVVLSGMSDMAQLDDNLASAENAFPGMLSSGENDVFKSVIDIMNSIGKVPCTGCNYCMPCPQGVNIPGCFTAYNLSFMTGLYHGFRQYVSSTGLLNRDKDYSAGKCVKCGKCEKNCPQRIKIIKSLETVKKRMEPFLFMQFLKIFRKLRT